MVVTDIYKLVAEIPGQEPEVQPRIFFDIDKAEEKAKAILATDSAIEEIRIYREIPDAETGSFTTIGSISVKR